MCCEERKDLNKFAVITDRRTTKAVFFRKRTKNTEHEGTGQKKKTMVHINHVHTKSADLPIKREGCERAVVSTGEGVAVEPAPLLLTPEQAAKYN